MKTTLWVLAAITAVTIGLWVFGTDRRDDGWSCEPEAARQALDAGVAANMKYYGGEALEHFERALELSPDCAVAQLAVARRLPWDSPRRKELIATLEATDLSSLPPREAFLVGYFVAGFRGDHDRQEEILDAYLKSHPQDPYALEQRCERLWIGDSEDDAEHCYEKLLRVDPNWVVAQNRLGYLAMARGELAKAEDRFRTYRYVAPDQANPHDSLGELLVLRGRYQEADAELDQALAVRPDFCVSYEHLVFSQLDQGEVEAARATLARGLATGECDSLHGLTCEIDGFALYRAEDWPALAARWDEPCHGEALHAPWLPYLGALMVGDLGRAQVIEDAVAGGIEKKSSEGMALDRGLGLLRGLRDLAERKPAAAEDELRRLDAVLAYKNMGIGRTKLYTRLALAEALERQGKDQEAEKWLAAVAAVNPHYVEVYRAGEITFPGG